MFSARQFRQHLSLIDIQWSTDQSQDFLIFVSFFYLWLFQGHLVHNRNRNKSRFRIRRMHRIHLLSLSIIRGEFVKIRAKFSQVIILVIFHQN